MPTILLAINCPVSPCFSGSYLPSSGPLGSHLFAQGDTTTVRPGLNENAARSDLNARFGGGGYALVHGMALSAGAGLVLNIAAGQAQINSAVTYPGGTANLTDAGRNWIWISQAGAITVVFNSLTPPAGAQALVGSALTAAGAISSVDTSGVLLLVGGELKRHTADATTPTDTPPAQIQFHAFGIGTTHWFWNGLAYYSLTGVTLPVSVANGGTGATTAAGARTALGVSREGQLVVTVNGNEAIAAADTTYSQIELSQGSVAAPWTFTFPTAASMLAAGTVAGHQWIIRNDTGKAVTINHTGGGVTNYLSEQSQGTFFFDGAEVRTLGVVEPLYASLTASAADHTFGVYAEQIKSLIDIEASGADRNLLFVGDTGNQRGRFWVIRNDNDSTRNVTAKTSGGDANYNTLLIPGEIQPAVMLSDGLVSAAPNRPLMRRVVANFGSDANKTLSVLEALAYYVEVTDTTPHLTTIRNVVLPLVSSHEWVVRNSTLQPLKFVASSGLGVTVRPGKTARIACNGTDFTWAESYALPDGGSAEVLGATIASATVANTTSEGSLVGTILQSNVIAANVLVPGRVIRVKAWGLVSTDASVAPTLTIRVKLGSVEVAGGGIIMVVGVANRLWELECMITCRTRGATGTVFSQGRWYLFDAAVTASLDGVEMSNATTDVIDTTATQTIGLTAQWTIADTDNTIECSNCIIEVLN